MLWEYVYIGSDMIKTSLIGLCLTWPTGTSPITTSHQPTAQFPKNRKRRRPAKKAGSTKTNPRGRSNKVQQPNDLGALLALEPRIMFDGAALLTGAEVVQDQSTQDQAIQDQDLQGIEAEAETFSDPLTDSIDLYSALSTVTAPTDRQEIVFIDTRVEDYQTLLLGIDPSAEAVLLDPTRDGIEQMAEILRDRSNIDAIHLIAEGNTAELHLGTSFLTQEAIGGEYADLFTQLGQSLSAEADLLIYGCNFGQGQAGQDAMNTLAKLTGADIAASTDRTGHSTEYADWDLEVSTGTIETSIVIGETTQEAWEGVFATYTVTTTTDGGAGSLRQAIIDANANSGTDTITFVGSGTYMLTIAGTGENAAATGDLDITDDLIIIGNGTGNTIIDGGGLDRVFDIFPGATATISDLTIQNGGNVTQGGGIQATGGGGGAQLTLTNVVLQNNSASNFGGGIYNDGVLTLTDVTISGNTSAGGDGGGLNNAQDATLMGVTISGNSADEGGGIWNDTTSNSLSLTNVTISGNTATSNGGGLYSEKSVDLTNVTVAANSATVGGGIFTFGGQGDAVLKNTILANNTGNNANRTLTSLGNNIDSDGTAGLGDPLDGVDPMLGALADNGGPTQTHALLLGSPAINAGTASGAPTTDQRGIGRDATPDIGAFEYESTPLVSTNEFVVNNPSGDNEETSGPVRGTERAVDIAPNGDYVVVWTDETLNNKVFAKVFDANGNETVAQFQVNMSGGTNQWTDVAVDDGGNFVVVWNQGDDIYMRRFLADGTAIDAGDVRVNTTSSNVQQNASINMNGAGDFVIAWEGDGSGVEGIFVRQGSFGGGLTGSDITVDTTATAQDPSLGIADNGNFVVVWNNGLGDVFFQLYNSAATPLTSGQVDLFQANAAGAAVEMAGDGRFTVAYHATGTGLGIWARQYDAAGTPLWFPILVNTSIAGDQTNPSISMDDTGDFIVVWEGVGDQVGHVDADGIFGQKFASHGSKIGTEFRINQTTTNVQNRASVAMLDRDDFVVVWTGSDGTQTDVFARQFGGTVPPTLDLDADNSSGATGIDYQFTFTEGDGPTAIADSDTDLSDPDSVTFPSVALAISGLLDGNAEVLILDGNTFALATAVAGQDTTGGNYHVAITTGAGTATVTITKQGGGSFSEIETETLITAIQYQHMDGSAPTGGNRLIDVTVNDGTTDSVAARTTINVNPVNDAPVNTVPGTQTIPEETQTAIAGISVADVDAAAGTISTRLQVSNGVLDVTLSGVATISAGANGTNDLTIQGTVADVNATLASLLYTGNTDVTGVAADTLTVTTNDGGNTGTGGAQQDVDTVQIDLTAVNDPPTFTGLDNTPTFIEGGAPVVLDNNATIADPELDAANNYNGATLTLVRNGGANADDLFDGSGTLNPLLESGSLVVSGTTIGTVTTNSGGTLFLTFNSNATTALVTSALQQITYANGSSMPPASVQIDFTIDDGNTGSQGSGGALNGTGSITVTIAPANNPPVAVADGFTVNEGSTNTLNLAGNDSDSDDGLDLTSITIVSGPTNGSIDSINTDGTVDYTHNGSETVADSFTYTIRDLAGAISNTVTVSLTVTPQNDAPIIISNGGGATATVSVITGNTAVTDVNATDAESTPLTYSIIGGADAALFSIDPTTGVLTFITAPDLTAPSDVGGDNVYNVLVQTSDGTAVDSQAIAVTVTNTPVVVLPPPPEPSPEPPPPPDEGDPDEDLSPIGVNIISQSNGFSFGASQGPILDNAKNVDSNKKPGEQDLAMIQLQKGNKGLGSSMSELLDFLGKPLGISTFKSEIQSLLGSSSKFLKGLDDVRDELNNVSAAEKTYVASSIAATTGLSIGYVIWLLRSGVLLTALLSSVPAWQFVNPLLVLGSPAKKKRKKGQEDLEDDSLESMFDNDSHDTETLEEPAQVTPKTRQSSWFRRF